MEVIMAYLLGKLKEEIYMMQPEGFVRMGMKRNIVLSIATISLWPQASSVSLEPQNPHLPHQDWFRQIHGGSLPLYRRQAQPLMKSIPNET